MNNIHLRYASYIIRHKWFVLVAGLQTGAPLWRLIVHDASKLSRAEWSAYARYFYAKKSKYPQVNRSRAAAFDAAWLHHQNRNPHHWQYYVLLGDDGSERVLAMPEHFVRELVADWMGAGRAITGKWEVAAWYEKNKHLIKLHPWTRSQVERLIEEAT